MTLVCVSLGFAFVLSVGDKYGGFPANLSFFRCKNGVAVSQELFSEYNGFTHRYIYGLLLSSLVPRPSTPSADEMERSGREKGEESAKPGPMTRSGRKTTIVDLHVEYAKSGRSSCAACPSRIRKGEIRIGKMVLDLELAERRGFLHGGEIPSWHHTDCFLQCAEELGAAGVGVEELTGYSKLKREDQEAIAEKFAEKRGSVSSGGSERGRNLCHGPAGVA